jgi:aspartyl-tRNA(Asn)/glutamyl-tRNA(Gln) amidotransferase subunit C
MASISISDVHNLANLSNLSLSDTEADSLRIDLEEIVNYIEELKELNTEGVNPTYQVTDLSNVWREDSVIDYGVTREQLLELSPEQKDNSVKVPKVL